MTRDESLKGALRPAKLVIAMLPSLLVLGSASRVMAACGDGILDAGEQCDDGTRSRMTVARPRARSSPRRPSDARRPARAMCRKRATGAPSVPRTPSSLLEACAALRRASATPARSAPARATPAPSIRSAPPASSVGRRWTSATSPSCAPGRARSAPPTRSSLRARPAAPRRARATSRTVPGRSSDRRRDHVPRGRRPV